MDNGRSGVRKKAKLDKDDRRSLESEKMYHYLMLGNYQLNSKLQ